MDLRQIGQRGEDSLISQRDIDDAMVSERAQGCDGGRFLSASLSAGGNENPGILAPIPSGLPEMARAVPECLPLRRKVAITGRNAKEKTVISCKDIGGDEGNIWRLARSVHLGKHLLRESFLHSAEILIRSYVKLKTSYLLKRNVASKRMDGELFSLRTDINLPSPPRPQSLPSQRQQAGEYDRT